MPSECENATVPAAIALPPSHQLWIGEHVRSPRPGMLLPQCTVSILNLLWHVAFLLCSNEKCQATVVKWAFTAVGSGFCLALG